MVHTLIFAKSSHKNFPLAIGYKIRHLIFCASSASWSTYKKTRSTNHIQVWSLPCLGVDSCDKVLRKYMQV